jgi:hypothetical protein
MPHIGLSTYDLTAAQFVGLALLAPYLADGIHHLLFWAQNVCDPTGGAVTDELGHPAGNLGLT